MQSYYVLTNPKNIEILKIPEYKEFARMPQGRPKARTPSNQFISFDCISSIDYVNYCNQLAGANYPCPDNEFSGLILPLMSLMQTELGYIYTTGHHANSIKMINPSQMPRSFADFSLFCDICAIQNMNPTYFNMIKNLLQIRKNLGYNIIIQEIQVFPVPDCVDCDNLPVIPLDSVLERIVCNEHCNYKIINIDIETIMMLFVLFLLISNNNIDRLAEIQRAMTSGNTTNIFKTIDEHSIYPIDLLSYACRPGRETIKRFLTELAEGQLPRPVITASSYNSDSDDDSDAETVIDDDDPIVKDVTKSVLNILIRRSARLANQSENTGEKGSFYISTQIQQKKDINKIVDNLMKKSSLTRIPILRHSLRIAQQNLKKKGNTRFQRVESPYRGGGKRTKSQKTRKRNKRSKRSKRNKTSKRKKHN
jgi:hypothetical protein